MQIFQKVHYRGPDETEQTEEEGGRASKTLKSRVNRGSQALPALLEVPLPRHKQSQPFEAHLVDARAETELRCKRARRALRYRRELIKRVASFGGQLRGRPQVLGGRPRPRWHRGGGAPRVHGRCRIGDPVRGLP